MTRNREDLIRELSADLGPGAAEHLLDRLVSHTVPEPSAQETDVLIARLRPLLPRHQVRRFRPDGLTQDPGAILLAHLAAQTRLFRPVWWLGSLLLVLAGLILAEPLASGGLSLAVLAPVLVMAGLAYGFRTIRGGALELELACPVTPVQMILSRLLILLGYDFLLGVLAGLTIGAPGLLLLSWTACLLLFTGLMLALTLCLGTTAAVVGALSLWGLQLLLVERGLSLFTLPGAGLWMPMQVGAMALGLILVALSVLSDRLQLMMGRGVS